MPKQREEHMIKTKRREREKKRRFLYLLTAAVLTGVMIFSGIKLGTALWGYHAAAKEYGDLEAAAVEKVAAGQTGQPDRLRVDFAKLREINPDCAGWLYIPDTDINYPIAAADDYWEYLYTTFDGKSNNCGSIFTDYRCASDWSDPNMILYGHRMNDGSMFGNLKKYFNADYLNAHKTIYIYTEKGTYEYTVFSVYEAVAGDETYTAGFVAGDSFAQWAQKVAGNSAVGTGIGVGPKDKVLILSTCKGGDNDYRTVVAAVLSKTTGQ